MKIIRFFFGIPHAKPIHILITHAYAGITARTFGHTIAVSIWQVWCHYLQMVFVLWHCLFECCWKCQKSTVNNNGPNDIVWEQRLYSVDWSVSGRAKIWSIRIFRFDWWFSQSLINCKLQTPTKALCAAWFCSRFMSIRHVYHVRLISKLRCPMWAPQTLGKKESRRWMRDRESKLIFNRYE